MSRNRRGSIAMAMAVAAVLCTSQSAMASSPQSAAQAYPTVAPGALTASPGGDQSQVIIIDSSTGKVSMQDAEPQEASAAGPCVAYTRGDDVHISAAQVRAVSGHGWWDSGGCSSTNRADIKMVMQAYYSDGSWRNVGTPGEKLRAYPGGGSANRANARMNCRGYAQVTFRTVIDVDINYVVDDSSKLTTRAITYNCTV